MEKICEKINVYRGGRELAPAGGATFHPPPPASVAVITARHACNGCMRPSRYGPWAKPSTHTIPGKTGYMPTTGA